MSECLAGTTKRQHCLIIEYTMQQFAGMNEQADEGANVAILHRFLNQTSEFCCIKQSAAHTHTVTLTHTHIQLHTTCEGVFDG